MFFLKRVKKVRHVAIKLGVTLRSQITLTRSAKSIFPEITENIESLLIMH